MKLPDAIAILRKMHSECIDSRDATAIAVCIEALEAPHSTLKSAAPTTKEERPREWMVRPPLCYFCGGVPVCTSQDEECDYFKCGCGAHAVRAERGLTDWFPPRNQGTP